MKLFVVAAVLVAVYVLYRSGYGVTSAKTALMYMGAPPKKTSWGATVKACTGTVSRMIRLEAGQDYTFVFDAETDKGEISAGVKDSAGRQVLALNESRPTARFHAQGSKYTLSLHYSGADGNVDINWAPALPGDTAAQ